jgi:hypothetical protein
MEKFSAVVLGALLRVTCLSSVEKFFVVGFTWPMLGFGGTSGRVTVGYLFEHDREDFCWGLHFADALALGGHLISVEKIFVGDFT